MLGFIIELPYFGSEQFQQIYLVERICICIWINVFLYVFESKLNKIFIFVFVFEKSKFLYLYLTKRIRPQPWLSDTGHMCCWCSFLLLTFPPPNWRTSLTTRIEVIRQHKAWSSIEEVPYCFSRSSVKFQDHTGKKSPILTQIEHFQTNSSWNSLMALKWSTKLDVV